MSVTLAPSGQKMPLVGFGLWKIDTRSCADQVYAALKTGYRLLDGACDYGNEKEAGIGIRRAIDHRIVARADIFLTSKLWNTFHNPNVVKTIAKRQLADYGLEYFDLFLIHFPIALKYVDPQDRYPPGFYADGKSTIEYENIPIQDTWKAMEDLVDCGIARNIGISNFQSSLILDLLRYARIRPAVLQIEHHPYLVQQPLLDLCAQENIAVTAYSSFGPQSFLELKMNKAEQVVSLLQHDTISSIARKLNKTNAQVLLAWSTLRHIAVIPKSNKQARLEENLNCLDLHIDSEDMKAITALDKGLRFNDPHNYGIPITIFA
ncbi:putative NAD(P)H-dependent D-xylose reductase xyl1 [Neolecta irregularis DAH-3]|uniref:Putative NAD(P)H-dependent D-xylose reductase xyl1 n=1 Tax=Neolecta irregularis (strain DAH-3) TaxID=1198029 RepID=A0A1U7LSF5_NEOID|nr:putative NAD(P)H-dependent D-xylose reductase xyl1 [Neolecta irregularis DAH-3]|eukprot:OLL25513.1 putative NAD(P)H-dependent D-xylose reductase xyl1 [Neolecta irregularis DAH-3]